MCVRAPHFCVPRLQKIAEPAKVQLYVVLRSTVKRVSHMRTGRGTGRNACMQFFAATSFWSVFGSRLTQRIFEIPVPKKVRPAGFFWLAGSQWPPRHDPGAGVPCRVRSPSQWWELTVPNVYETGEYCWMLSWAVGSFCAWLKEFGSAGARLRRALTRLKD